MKAGGHHKVLITALLSVSGDLESSTRCTAPGFRLLIPQRERGIICNDGDDHRHCHLIPDYKGCSDAEPEARTRARSLSSPALGFAADADLRLGRSQSRKQSVAGGDLKGHRPPTPGGRLRQGHVCRRLPGWSTTQTLLEQLGEGKKYTPSHPNHGVGVAGTSDQAAVVSQGCEFCFVCKC